MKGEGVQKACPIFRLTTLSKFITLISKVSGIISCPFRHSNSVSLGGWTRGKMRDGA
jgi:hypothetical protein